MRNWKLWTFAVASAIAALIALFWRLYDPMQHAYVRHVAGRVEEAISLLEKDTAAYHKETQDAVRLVAAAAAEGMIVSPKALYVLAVQHEREGDLETAETVFRQAIGEAEEWSWPYVALGTLLARFGGNRLDEAELLLRKAIELQPDWVRPYNSLSVVLRMLTRYDEAESVALQALELAPDDVAAHNNYANLLVVLERFEEAETHYTIAMEKEPENAKPPYNLACLYSITGLYEDACDYLELAIALSESSITDAAVDPYFDSMRSYPRFEKLLYGAVIASEEEVTPSADAGTEPGNRIMPNVGSEIAAEGEQASGPGKTISE